jgi:hypothetical protein
MHAGVAILNRGPTRADEEVDAGLRINDTIAPNLEFILQ